MCENWRKVYFNKYSCEGMVLNNDSGDIIVKGKTKSNNPNATVLFWAPAPADYITSYSGSGLPFASQEMAFDNTPNTGSVKSSDGNFEFKLKYPNGYYTGLGTVYMSPHVNIKVCENDKEQCKEIVTIKLSEGIPFRSLSYPPPPGTAPRCSPMFYMGRDRLPVRTQEQICRDSGYPQVNKMPDNFWGLAIPQ